MKREQRRIWVRVAVGALPMAAMMVVIFLFSHRAGDLSAAQSDGFGAWVLSVLGIEIPPGQSASDVPIVFGLTIRKLAHIFLYLLLGACAYLFAAQLPVPVPRAWQPAVCAAGAAVISFLYACLDEWHQSFVAGRDGKMADVGVDAIGFVSAALLCMAAVYLARAVARRRAARRERRENTEGDA